MKYTQDKLDRLNELYDQWKASGLTRAAFCEEHFEKAGYASRKMLENRFTSISRQRNDAKRRTKWERDFKLCRYEYLQEVSAFCTEVISLLSDFQHEVVALNKQEFEVSLSLNKKDHITVNRYCIAGYKADFQTEASERKVRIRQLPCRTASFRFPTQAPAWNTAGALSSPTSPCSCTQSYTQWTRSKP